MGPKFRPNQSFTFLNELHQFVLQVGKKNLIEEYGMIDGTFIGGMMGNNRHLPLCNL